MQTGLPVLLTYWAAFGMALISPGPNFALMLKIGLGAGRPAALRTVLGIAVGEAIWGCAAVFGVAALALRYPALGTAIRRGGGDTPVVGLAHPAGAGLFRQHGDPTLRQGPAWHRGRAGCRPGSLGDQA